eukprot:TRINITY_DN10637_c0_g1_i1.p1 TRINITY_DN10637_c0_g1~~TRINITY_DN10637_c0_g1_i1.p1  ORF type:complete len:349 (+),score=26.79 TRINITY_DN10637_c0_g1_i1:724-1770(+)
MIQPASILYVLGVTTLGLASLLSLAGLLCILYVLHFRFKTHRCNFFALREFNSFWGIRILLVVFGILWVLTEVTRLPLLRYNGWVFSSVRVQTQVCLCKGYLVLSQGFVEPCFFLTALFLVHGSLNDGFFFHSRRKASARAVFNILVCCLPMFLLQLLIVVLAPGLQKRYAGFFPSSFVEAYEIVQLEESHSVAWCTYPLWNTLVLGAFGVMFGAYFLYICWRMVSLVINKRLQCRVYGLAFVVVLCLPLQVIILVFTVFRRPVGVTFELLCFLGFMISVVTIGLGGGILVVRPISDALAVRRVFDCDSRFGKTSHPFNSASIEVFPVPCVSKDGEESLLGQPSKGEN